MVRRKVDLKALSKTECLLGNIASDCRGEGVEELRILEKLSLLSAFELVRLVKEHNRILDRLT